ncbi:MAG: phenylacetate--CoA ligase [Chloroflexi bacterium]|nr:MAG: phenylacetate--CoA ligase [Chloroflexota bacterium]TME15966.1 MAG: phenylacetate--CoA ligase [Chloroflexota bacterium]TME18775.1 MAG: phenylacetate--CoA ligase [Chloroflexota bacterium]
MAVLQDTSLQRLNALVDWLRDRVPFYRERLPDARLKNLEEIAGLPFTVKDDFRTNYPFGLFAVPLGEIVRLHMSSGTTGKPVVTGYTRSDLEVWADCMERVLLAADVKPDDVVQNAYGYGLFTGGLGFHIGAERIGCTVVPTSSGVTARQVMLMQDLGTTILACTPSYALVLAEALGELDVRRELKLRAGFFGAEPWTDGMRGQIESGLGLEAFDIYGLTELGGPGVAVECHQHDGLHIFEDHFFAETVDPDTGKPVARGKEGELVLTSLTRRGTPVLRYRTRDLTILSDGPCKCGNPFVRMLKVRGRTDDMLKVRGVNIFPSQVEELLLSVPGLTGNYQLVVDRTEQKHDEMQVLVEAKEGSGHDRLAEAARGRIKEMVGLTVEVTVLSPGVLPRTEGKARRVIDRRELDG